MIRLFTIGFAGKSAETFFDLLTASSVKGIIDTRLHNTSQLSGFAKAQDLKFFAKKIAGISYEHRPEFAPSEELLARYRNKVLSWDEYATAYLNLLDERKVAQHTDVDALHECCFLCSEHRPEKCHRRLLVEYFMRVRNDIEVVHL